MRVREDQAEYAKRPANLSVNAALLDQAKALDINLSATFEAALEVEVRVRKRERWLAENSAAITAYNAHLEEHGIFGDHVRLF